MAQATTSSLSSRFNVLETKIIEIKRDLKKQSATLKKMRNRNSVDFITDAATNADKIMKFYSESDFLILSPDGALVIDQIKAGFDNIKPPKTLPVFKVRLAAIKVKFDELVKIIIHLKENNGKLGKGIKNSIQTATDQCDHCLTVVDSHVLRIMGHQKNGAAVLTELDECHTREHEFDERYWMCDEFVSQRELLVSSIQELNWIVQQLKDIHSFVSYKHNCRLVPEDEVVATVILYSKELDAYQIQLRELTIKKKSKDESVRDVISYWEGFQSDANMLINYYQEVTKIYKLGILDLMKNLRKTIPGADKFLADWAEITFFLEKSMIATKDLDTYRDLITHIVGLMRGAKDFLDERNLVLETAKWAIDE